MAFNSCADITFRATTAERGKSVRVTLRLRKLPLPVGPLNFPHCMDFWDRWLNIIAPNFAATSTVLNKVREGRSLFLIVLALYHWVCKSHLYNGGGRGCVSASIRPAFAVTCIDLWDLFISSSDFPQSSCYGIQYTRNRNAKKLGSLS